MCSCWAVWPYYAYKMCILRIEYVSCVQNIMRVEHVLYVKKYMSYARKICIMQIKTRIMRMKYV